MIESPEDFERHADLEHEIWSSWMRKMCAIADKNPDGTWTIPAWAVERWTRQMNTRYEDLPEDEKITDREQVLKHIQLVRTGEVHRVDGTENGH